MLAQYVRLYTWPTATWFIGSKPASENFGELAALSMIAMLRKMHTPLAAMTRSRHSSNA